MEFLYTLNEIQKPVSYLRNILEERNLDFPVILLTGEMGAGKTTFTSHFVRSFDSNLNPNSPTFNLMNEYKTSKFSIFHFDLYRLKHTEELFDLGIEEYLDSGQFCFIEWPEKIIELIDTN